MVANDPHFKIAREKTREVLVGQADSEHSESPRHVFDAQPGDRWAGVPCLAVRSVALEFDAEPQLFDGRAVREDAFLEVRRECVLTVGVVRTREHGGWKGEGARTHDGGLQQALVKLLVRAILDLHKDAHLCHSNETSSQAEHPSFRGVGDGAGETNRRFCWVWDIGW